MRSSFLQLHRIPLQISSWAVFAIALAIYWVTADPGASYWDCPEYVTSASRLEVGHPPGNPIWMLVMRAATIPFPAQHHAYVINLCSGVFMAFTSFFLCKIIFVIVSGLLIRLRKKFKLTAAGISIVSSFIAAGGSLCYAFCDSAWFSAVEAEVYAMSAMLTSATLWIMVVWWFEKSKSRRLRFLFLLSYLIGLSLGVHQLNLLCIPVFVLIMVYRRHPGRLRFPVAIFWMVVSLAIIVLILYGIMHGILKWASMYELLFVNGLGMPFNSGVIAFAIILAMLLIIAIAVSQYLRNYHAVNALWMIAFVLLGFSSFALILIRGAANPYMNEGSPSDIFALTSYIERDQYTSAPLLYGQTPYSNPMFEENIEDGTPYYGRYALEKGKASYIKSRPDARLKYRSGFVTGHDSVENQHIMQRKGDGYILSDYEFTQVMTPELDMWFPRITSRNSNDREAYADWAGMTEETMHRVAISEAFDSVGNPVNKMNDKGEREEVFSYRPTYGQQLQYFLTYQTFYMYFRYLLWNFMGRQNDYHSIGEIDHGNFITGFPFADDMMLGPISATPEEIGLKNAGRNNYYSIPFIIALAGIIWLGCRGRLSRRILTLITLFFIMTGLAIVVYLNQLPAEPRERDYSFLGSYMAFSIWIASGFVAFFYGLLKILPKRLSYLIIIPFSLFPATLMAVENFDDHDRRGRFETTYYATSLLDFEEPAVIFTHGDNSTFPAWYAQEVLGKGPKHVSVDATYLNLPAYIVALKNQTSKEFRIMADESQIAYGTFNTVFIPSESYSEPLPLTEVLKELYEDSSDSPAFATSLVTIPDSDGDDVTINLRDISGGSSYLTFKQLMVLDIIASQLNSKTPKAVYFPGEIDWKLYRGLKRALNPALFGKVYAPHLSVAEINSLMTKGVERELEKLEALNPKPHYADPVTADKSVRYRGELIIAANELIERGDTVYPRKIIESIEKYYPYSELLPGTFTVEDSTYYEGKEYLLLVENLYSQTGNEYLKTISEKQRQLMEKRRNEWLKYYGTLTKEQRQTLSNRSKRLLL